MKRLEHMKETLVSCVEAELCNIKEANTHELGAAVDMIKDLEEAIYYCTITKAMNEPKQKMMQDMGGQSQHQQQEPKYYPDTKYMKYNSSLRRCGIVCPAGTHAVIKSACPKGYKAYPINRKN